MPITGQTFWRVKLSSSGEKVHEKTFVLQFSDITADAALSFVNNGNNGWAECGFSEIDSSEAGFEAYDPAVPVVHRKGVANVTFRTTVVNSQTWSRCVINFWGEQPTSESMGSGNIEPEAVSSFVGYDVDTGEVVSVHELWRMPGAGDERGSPMNIGAIRQRLARDLAGRRTEVIEVPSGFQLQGDAEYRVDPKTKAITAADMPCDLREAAARIRRN